jgi:hypothetical protein
MLTTPASAEWVKMAESNRGTVYFVDDSTIFDQGNTYYVKVLVNYSYKQETGELSSVSDTILNCTNKMMKDTRIRYYSKRSKKGRKIGDDDLVSLNFAFWRSSASGSLENLFVSRLCSSLQK